jgi:putative phosphoribosyl transferase
MEKEIKIKINSLSLPGILSIPQGSEKLVIFAHGSGSSRKSPRNLFVAEKLQRSGIATLLFDLLTEEEDLNYKNRFNIDLITERLILAVDWLNQIDETKNIVKGFFGASTGAAAALKAAAKLPEIKTVVSRGGRPDLAIDLGLLSSGITSPPSSPLLYIA